MRNTIKVMFVAFLMVVAALFISAGDIIFEDGNLNIADSLFVDTNTLYVDSSSGNVGIGTASPGDTTPSGWEDTGGTTILDMKSTVSGNDVGLFMRRLQDSSIGTDIWLDTGSGHTYIDNRYNHNNGRIYFRTRTSGTPVNAVTILGDGNVGVGTTSPNVGSFAGRVLTISDIANAKAPYIELVGNPTDTGEYLGGIVFYDEGAAGGFVKSVRDGYSYDLILGTKQEGASLIENVRIDAGGNVGIGTTSPSTKLQVGDLSTTSIYNTYLSVMSGLSSISGLYLKRYDGSYGFTIESSNDKVGLDIIRHSNSAAGVSAMFISESTGNVGIGTTSPDTEFEVVGRIEVSNTNTGGNAGTSLCIDANNRICKCGSCA